MKPISKNQKLAELLNIKPSYSLPNNCGKITYPDFAADPRLVLNGIYDKDEFVLEFIYYIGGKWSREDELVPVSLILDTTGKLRRLAIEFFEDRDYEAKI